MLTKLLRLQHYQFHYVEHGRILPTGAQLARVKNVILLNIENSTLDALCQRVARAKLAEPTWTCLLELAGQGEIPSVEALAEDIGALRSLVSLEDICETDQQMLFAVYMNEVPRQLPMMPGWSLFPCEYGLDELDEPRRTDETLFDWSACLFEEVRTDEGCFSNHQHWWFTRCDQRGGILNLPALVMNWLQRWNSRMAIHVCKLESGARVVRLMSSTAVDICAGENYPWAAVYCKSQTLTLETILSRSTYKSFVFNVLMQLCAGANECFNARRYAL